MTENKQREAMLAESGQDQVIHCHLCGHRCRISAGKFGQCRVRENVGGTLISRNYGHLVAANADPIEKKPLYHVLPGSLSMSVAAPGCNFRCSFCQNWQISQLSDRNRPDSGQAIAPEQIVTAAERGGCASISYTYTEPTIYFELAYDTANIAAERGLKNCFVSNGYMTPEAVETISPVLDAINVDLKAFRDETYRTIMRARLEPVLQCLRALVAAGVWVEVTTLVVPGMNDSEPELRDLVQFIAEDLGRDVPWHISRFHGDYEMTGVGATPPETLELARRLGRDAGLRYIYLGNIASADGVHTDCPECGARLIDRGGYRGQVLGLTDGACSECSSKIPGVWA